MFCFKRLKKTYDILMGKFCNIIKGDGYVGSDGHKKPIYSYCKKSRDKASTFLWLRTFFHGHEFVLGDMSFNRVKFFKYCSKED